MVIRELAEQGTSPDMVQIGNEINHGMVWPEGHIGNADNLATLLKAGIEGVKKADPNILIMLHVALGGQHDESVFWFDNMFSRGVDCDLIGLSYYPRWHGTLGDLRYNMNLLIQRYHKPINVVEYSHMKTEVNQEAFTLPDDMGTGTFIWEPLNTWDQVFDKDGRPNSKLMIYDELAKKFLPSSK
jgi:beta-galactosidase